MNTIKKILTEYEKLLYKNYKYTLSNGTELELYFTKEHLPHLLGLQYLTDIPILNDYSSKKQSATKVYNALKKGIITDEQINNSIHFVKIQDRFENIINIDNVCFKNIVYKFDKDVASTNIIADILLLNFDGKLKLHLFIKKDTNKNKFVPVSFFNNNNSKYFDGQEILMVEKLEIIEHKKGKNRIYN